MGPAGTFLRGSHEDEPGRFGWEGPQHEVTLTEGFWLGDTPVTQALYAAVMGDNPSRFADPDRPVESVGFDDVEGFLAEAERLHPGLGLRCPTEAEWEYACRANTKAATYAGPIEILGERHAPVLDAISWYGGNSAVEYDLEAFHDSRDWKEKHHPHERAGTRKVKTRRRNPWGLYDMLGNVWEWCADPAEGFGRPAPYSAEPVRDPRAPNPERPLRVSRGGSWLGLARYVRAAFRRASPRGSRLVALGFRVAGGRAASGPARGAGLGGAGFSAFE